jgi:hypothetical protein
MVKKTEKYPAAQQVPRHPIGKTVGIGLQYGSCIGFAGNRVFDTQSPLNLSVSVFDGVPSRQEDSPSFHAPMYYSRRREEGRPNNFTGNGLCR